MELHVGDVAPNITLPDQSGNEQRLADHRGLWIVVYFYPKDDTPGCTTEACAIRDAWPDLKKLNVPVFGISVDPVPRHEKFARKYRLPFTLLADADKHAVTAYGVWRKKKFMGREYMGTMRMSFLIDPAGKIAKIYEAVKPATHASELLEDIRALQKGRGRGIMKAS